MTEQNLDIVKSPESSSTVTGLSTLALGAAAVSPFFPPPIQSLLALFSGSIAVATQKVEMAKIDHFYSRFLRAEIKTALDKALVDKVTVATTLGVTKEFDEEKARLYSEAYFNFVLTGTVERVGEYLEAIEVLNTLTVREFTLLMLMRSAPNKIVGSFLIGNYNCAGKVGATLGSVIETRLGISPESLPPLLKRLESKGFYEPSADKTTVGGFPGFDRFLQILNIDEPVWSSHDISEEKAGREIVIDAIRFLFDFPMMAMDDLESISISQLKLHYNQLMGADAFEHFLRSKIREIEPEFSKYSDIDLDSFIADNLGEDEELRQDISSKRSFVISSRTGTT